MEITDEDVTEFQALYKARFDKDIDRQAAREKLTLLVRQMEIVYQPITKQQYQEYMERHDS
jgi:hypothetical protein